MGKIPKLLPGDRVIGTSDRYLNALGVVAEVEPDKRKRKITIDWDDGKRISVKMGSVKKLEAPGQRNPANLVDPMVQTGHENFSEDEESTEEQDSVGSSSSGSNSDESSAEEEEQAPEGLDAQEEQTEAENDGDPLPHALNPQPNPRQHGGNPGRGNGNAGRGRGGRGRGQAGRGKYQPPPPPDNLHAVLSPGNWSTPPEYHVWEQVDQVAVDLQVGHPTHKGTTELLWLARGVNIFDRLHMPKKKTALEYFILMFPMEEMNNIINGSNKYIEENRPGEAAVTTKEFFRFLGIRLAIALQPIKSKYGGLQSYWDCKKNKNTIFREHNDFLTRYEMSWHRFKTINECFRLNELSEDGVDPYSTIRYFVEGFNNRRAKVINPGLDIVVDECMSSWQGLESKMNHESLIKITKIKRKPRGVGIEMKCSADGETSIMLHLEIQEGKGAPKKYLETAPDSLPWHAAVTLRAVKPWWNSGRLIIADAAFASLTTTVECLKRGLYFIGVVKGCTKGYPVKFAQEFEKENPKKGTTRVLVTNPKDPAVADRKIMSVLIAIKDSKVRKVIGSYSCSTEGEKQRVHRSRRVMYEGSDFYLTTSQIIEVSRPKIVEVGMKHFGAVDLNDRYRQGYLALEEYWQTKKCWVRAFTTILGIIFTDAYLAYKHETEGLVDTALFDDIEGEEGRKLHFHEFLGELAHELIFNDRFDDINISRSTRSSTTPKATDNPKPVPTQAFLNTAEVIKNLVHSKYNISTAQGQKRLREFQRRCRICKMKASTYCTVCSDISGDCFFACCSMGTKKGCWEKHLEDAHYSLFK